MANETFTIEQKAFNDLLKRYSDKGAAVENTLNEYIHNVAPEKIKPQIMDFIPVSDRNKQHARNSAPFGRQENFNLAVKVITSKEFNYLIFPDEGLGTSKGNIAQDFTGRGLDAVLPALVDDMTAKITETFTKGGLKNECN